MVTAETNLSNIIIEIKDCVVERNSVDNGVQQKKFLINENTKGHHSIAIMENISTIYTLTRNPFAPLHSFT